jgi:hypothetical protein
VCAIHQPNLFPRLSTLAKLFAADRWIVLDDVQFARRDYQHRTRLAALDDPTRQQWLTLPTHLPNGRPTLVNRALLVEPRRSRRTVSLLIRQYYGRSRYWPAVSEVLDVVLDRFENTDRVADLARTSTVALLTALGWSGEVLESSAIPTRQGRFAQGASVPPAKPMCLNVPWPPDGPSGNMKKRGPKTPPAHHETPGQGHTRQYG